MKLKIELSMELINKQNVITIKDFEEAYNNRGSIKIFEDLSLDNKKILLIEKNGIEWYLQSRYNAEKACDDWISQFENKLVDDTIIWSMVRRWKLC